MQKDEIRATPHETGKREPHPDFTEAAIARQVAAFLAAGGKPQQIPFGQGAVKETGKPRERQNLTGLTKRSKGDD